jgi:spermidine synthase
MAHVANRRRPGVLRRQVDSGVAELVPDPDRTRAWTLFLDADPQSHVDLDDPTYLEFEYVRRLGHVVDLIAAPGVPIRVLHLGGGGLTLPRYVAATRPGSRQHVFESDAALVAFVRGVLPMPRGTSPRIRIGDGRALLTAVPPGVVDLLIMDVFAGARLPAHLTSVEFVAAAARSLRAEGLYTANIADGGGLEFARGQVATALAVFRHVCLIANPAVLRGRRFGNLVLVAANRELPTAHLARRVASDPFPARVCAGESLARFTGGAAPVTDATARASPPPPAGFLHAAQRSGRHRDDVTSSR